MTDQPVVVVVTSRKDVPADMVVRHLGGDDFPTTVHRIDPADMESGYLRLDGQISNGRCSFSLIDPHRITHSDQIRSIWWRKPSTTTRDEGHAQLEGVLRTLDNVRWLNHPDTITRAAHKPVQLIAAQKAGFNVPTLCLPASREGAKGFANTRATGVVAKTLAIKGPVRYVTDDWETGFDDGPHPALQTKVIKQCDVRLTVVGSKMFAASVHPPHGELDWRTVQEQAEYKPIDIPEAVTSSVYVYMGVQRLFYGAFDFAVDQDDRWWFLECNPNGQSGFIELSTGLPISRAVANWLAGAHS